MREYTAPRLSMFSKPWLYSSGGERSRAHLREGEARGRRVKERQRGAARHAFLQGGMATFVYQGEGDAYLLFPPAPFEHGAQRPVAGEHVGALRLSVAAPWGERPRLAHEGRRVLRPHGLRVRERESEERRRERSGGER